jgi:hypothetical protein
VLIFSIAKGKMSEFGGGGIDLLILFNEKMQQYLKAKYPFV